MPFPHTNPDDLQKFGDYPRLPHREPLKWITRTCDCGAVIGQREVMCDACRERWNREVMQKTCE